MNFKFNFHRLLVGCLVLLPCAARADVIIYNAGAPDLGGTNFGDVNNGFAVKVASSFVLSAGSSTVTGAEWWGGCSIVGTCPAGNFTLSFYANNAGTPGSLIQSFSVGGANQTATGNNIGAIFGQSFAEYQYSASFAALALTPGTTYFFAIADDTARGDWGQESTNVFAADPAHFQLSSGGTWTSGPAKEAFELFGPSPASVPEPSSVVLFGSAILGLGATIRRKYL